MNSKNDGSQHEPTSIVSIDTGRPIWDRFFTIAPLVLVGTKEGDGGYDLAPKHLAMPLGWQNYFCFVCAPTHGTYQNIRRHGEFTVSYPRPDHVFLSALSASPRCDDQSKPILAALATFPATALDGVLVQGCYLFLECRLERIIDGFGSNSLIIGTVLAASALESALRRAEQDESDQIYAGPLLAYVSPGRFAVVRDSTAFPFPAGFTR
jgi:flavin reductase (DIM6/NTAB) family NADH-FMN oxidoreductase RutF